MDYEKLTFEKDDQLDRESDVMSIMRIISTLTKRAVGNDSISIAINARWGAGKSYFINMWKNWMRSDEFKDYKIIYYNAWEYDDCETPLLPLMYKIISATCDEDGEKFIEQVMFFFKECGSSVLKIGTKKIFGNDIDIANIINQGIDKLGEIEIKNIFEEYNKYYNYRLKFVEKLKELVLSGSKLWIFVDELDRCKPDFAIKTLELIKHYFVMENIFFIFSVDLEQLSNITKHIYGEKIDADAYLRKFFDFVYNLTSPNIKKYVIYKLEKVKSRILEDNDLQNYIVFLFKNLDFTLRDIDLTINHVIYFVDFYQDEIYQMQNLNQALHIYLYFLMIKDKYNVIYKKMLHGKFSVDKNPKSRWERIEQKFFVDKTIKEFLLDICKEKADEPAIGLIKKYGLFNKGKNQTFLNHMECVLNYHM